MLGKVRYVSQQTFLQQLPVQILLELHSEINLKTLTILQSMCISGSRTLLTTIIGYWHLLDAFLILLISTNTPQKPRQGQD